jgi:hypoxanthine phosphoribosyltransferase
MSDPTTLLEDIAEVVYTKEQLETRIAELGSQISADYAGKNPVLIGVLRGVYVFMADLARAITVPANVDFIGITRYGPSTRTQGVVRFTKDLDINITGRHVLFVEDVIDTGLTLRYILRTLKAREPATLRVCTLFNKPRARLFALDIDYIGFMLPDQFVVGYGLDYDEQYRHLPFVGVLKEEAITRLRLPPGAQTD